MTPEKMEELIEFQKRQIADLTAERDRLRDESANTSDALADSHATNANLSEQYADSVEALEMLGVTDEQEEQTDVG